MTTPEAQRRAEELVGTMLAGDAFTRWLGIEVTRVAPAACVGRLRVREEMLNGFGVCHGGVTFSLADSVLAFASNTHGTVTVSVESGISYPAPVHAGDVLTAVAEEDGASSRFAFYRVTVRNQDELTVALFRGTVYRTRKEMEGRRDGGAS